MHIHSITSEKGQDGVIRQSIVERLPCGLYIYSDLISVRL